MGTRCDYYVGTGKQAEWLGSTAHPPEPFKDYLTATSEEAFRREVAAILAEEELGGTTPDEGWPWPWRDSNTTDMQFCWVGRSIRVARFGRGFVTLKPGRNVFTVNWNRFPRLEWPDMSERQNVTFGPRSGLMILGS